MSDAEPIQEPQKLFHGLQNFLECGGFNGLRSPARCSVFNPEDDFFITIFPGKNRIYRFDIFGALYEKFSTPIIPLSALWCPDLHEYLIGFADGRILRFDSHLQYKGEVRLPFHLEPRLLAYNNGLFFAADGKSSKVIGFDLQGTIKGSKRFSGKITSLMPLPDHGKLAVGFNGGFAIIDSKFEIFRQESHTAPRTVITCSSNGVLWVGLSTGHLWRLGEKNAKLLDIVIPHEIHNIQSMDGGLIATSIQGIVTLVDLWGKIVGKEELGTSLFHIGSTEGSILVFSTSLGVTTLKPNPSIEVSVTQGSFKDDAVSFLGEMEKIIDSASNSNLYRQTKEYLEKLDLVRWKQVYAFQSVFLQKQKSNPVHYGKIAEALRFSDPCKAEILCNATIPVIIDGSNVSRFHWNNQKNTLSRLQAILNARGALQKQKNPVLYPIIIVVDESERRTCDDKIALKHLISEGEILETPSRREADALILNLIKINDWWDCSIVSNDRKLLNAHAEMLPQVDSKWYERVRQAFSINLKTGEVYFPEKSQ